MNLYRPFLIFIALVGTGVALFAADSPELKPNLESLRPWLGKTWKGEQKNSKSGKIATDVVRWERALNGNAIRVLHSINAGTYGGESILLWDEKTQTVVYHYFTTDTFTTTGTMTFKDGKILTHDVVHGDAGGITETRATIEMRPDGTYQQKTEFLKNGSWELAADTIYREDPSAVVIFK